ncbi:MAG: DNA polymerase III subunit delta' [Sphingobacteriales bacterium]|nr:MAG: DNA polymerase III subunit delta' [Sphingobacteriales bacterium]
MQFQEIIGQQRAKEGILHAIQAGRFPHAMLLAERPGTGGLPMALAIAQYLFCEQPNPTDSCGQCTGCRKVTRMEHPDLHFSYPFIKPEKVKSENLTADFFTAEFRKFVQASPYSAVYDWLQVLEAGNKQGNINVAECDNIIRKISFKPFEGGKKVLILWGADYLHQEGNRLLKMIEEPPADTHLIFVSSHPEGILATILSRVQTVRLPPLTVPELIAGLQQQGLVEDTRSASLAAITAEGSFAEAIRLANGAEQDLFPDFRNWFNAIFTNKGLVLTAFAEQLSKKGREMIKDFLSYSNHLLQAALLHHYAPDAPVLLPAEEGDFIRRLAQHKSIDAERIAALSESIATASHRISGNASSKIVLHGLGIQLSRIVYQTG